MIPDIPKPLTELVAAQNEYNSTAYTAVFSDDATVNDEGHDYHGKNEIKKWNEDSNKKYHPKLELIDFSAEGKESILTVSVSGTFDGSPIRLKYYCTIVKGKIQSLRISDK